MEGYPIREAYQERFCQFVEVSDDPKICSCYLYVHPTPCPPPRPGESVTNVSANKKEGGNGSMQMDAMNSARARANDGDDA